MSMTQEQFNESPAGRLAASRQSLQSNPEASALTTYPAVGFTGEITDGDPALAGNRLTLCDPITQLCKRIEAFFRGCPGITTNFCVNNNAALDWKKDDNGDYITGTVHDEESGNDLTVFYSEDHVCELRIYVEDVEQADALANVVRHRHVVNEEFGMGSPVDGSDAVGRRSHILNVRVFRLNPFDPMTPGSEAGILQESYGTFPIRFSELPGKGFGELPRRAPGSELDPSYPELPDGAPEEYEQKMWEDGFTAPDAAGGDPVAVSAHVASAWKWMWLKKAFKGNKNVIQEYYDFQDTSGNDWRFIECSRLPVVFSEDNLTSARGFNSILPADLLPLVFSVFGKFQIATYARKNLLNG